MMSPATSARVITLTPQDLLGNDRHAPLPTFPLEVLPPMVRCLINELHTKDGKDLAVLAVTALFTSSAAMGGLYRVRYVGTYVQSGMVWICVVQAASTGKSPAQEVMLAPLRSYNDRRMMAYNDAVRLRAASGAEGNLPLEGIALHDDITAEAIKERLAQRPQGIGLIKDELTDMMNNMGRYSGGDDTGFYLQAWNGNAMSSARKGRPTTYIPKSFVSISTGIQPALLKELPSKRNGFLVRWLWLFQDIAKASRTNPNAPAIDPDVLAAYDHAMRQLLQLGDDHIATEFYDPIVIDMSRDAQLAMHAFENEIKDRMDEVLNTPEAEMLGKLEVMTVRLSLVLEFLWWAADKATGTTTEGPRTTVGIASVQRAITLARFFRAHALKVLDVVYGDDPTTTMTEQQREVYAALPMGEFLRKDGVDMADEHGMKVRAFDEWIKDRAAFVKVKNGTYKKR